MELYWGYDGINKVMQNIVGYVLGRMVGVILGVLEELQEIVKIY